MKLARIILPIAMNEKQNFASHAYLRQQLIARYGGCTVTDGVGYWKPDGRPAVEEVVKIYDVAMARADVVEFRELARRVAKLASQECVMVVTPQGDVEFLKPRVDTPAV